MDDGFKGYPMSKHSGFTGGGRSSSAMNGSDEEEFEEADVWEAVHDHGHDPRCRSSSNFMMKKSKSSNLLANSSSTKKKAPRSSHESSSSSSRMGAHHHHHHHGGQPQSSGPLLAPGWPHNPASLSHRSSSKSGLDNSNGHLQQQQDEGEDQEEMIPPHEWIARRLASTQISSSVCEGAGRTLKGRDLSRVRNAVLTKTGFLEQ